MKNIVITAIGTRGDVRPALQLVKYLKTQYKITIIAPPENEIDISKNGIKYLPIGENYSIIVEKNDLQFYRKQIELQFDLYHEIYETADIIIGVSLFFAGKTMAEYFKKNYFHMFYTPQVIPSLILPPPSAIKISENKFKNALLWKKHYIETNVIYKNVINEKRKKYGLSMIKDVYSSFIDIPIIMMLDTTLYNMDQIKNQNIKQIMFPIYKDEDSFIDEKIIKKLEETQNCVLISLGSIKNIIKDKENYYKKIVKILKDHNMVPVIIDKIYKNIDDTIFIDYLPFDKALKYFDVVIHHGGIGTAMACLIQNIPQIIIPQILDQYFWAHLFAENKLSISIESPNELNECLDKNSILRIKENMAKYKNERTKIDIEMQYSTIFNEIIDK